MEQMGIVSYYVMIKRVVCGYNDGIFALRRGESCICP